MKYASQVANVEGLMNAVVQELKSHGVKAPKVKKLGSSKQDVKQPVKLFGTAVGLLPTVIVDENGVAVPRFLVDLLLAIEKDIAVEGLFRKAGSVVRQKDLRKNIENLQTWRGVQVHDIVSVMKQFLRELPEPLILSRYQDSLSKAQNLEDPGVRVYAIMLLCLLLPKENLDVMRFLMQFLHRVAANSHSNRMDAHNLAVVMTPNLTQLSEKLDKCNKTLMCQTGVVETLIVNADRIGMVPDLLVEQVELPLGHSDDELEKSGGAGLDTSQKRKKRNSLNGVLNNLRRRNMAQPKTPTSQNSASFTTVYATPTLSYDGYPVQRTAPKRRAEGEIDATPVKKNLEQKSQPQTLNVFRKTTCDYVQFSAKIGRRLSVGPSYWNTFAPPVILSSRPQTDLHLHSLHDTENTLRVMDSAEINPARKSSENICTNSNNRLPNTTVLDKCENREPASCSTNVSAMKCCNEITNVDKVEVVDCSSDDVSQNTRSKMRKVSFESKMETSQHDSISEETSQKLATPDISEKLSVHLRIRTSEEYQRSPRPRKVVSRSLREKGSGPLVEKLHRDKDTPTPDPSLRRSFSTQSCDKLNRSALRRGRPNTRKTGLPEPSPFKHAPSLKNETTSSNVEINRMTPMVVDKRRVEWLKGSDLFLEERKLNRSRLHFQSPSPQQKQSSLIELTKTSTESMEDVREKLLVSKLSESVFSLPSASEFQFRLQKPSFEADEETENDVSAKPLTVSRESLCSSGSCCSKNEASGTELEDDDGDDLGNLVLSEDEEEDPTGQVSVDNKNTVQEHVSLKICEYKEPEPVAKCKSVIVNDSSVDARASSDNVDVSFVSELPQNRSATTIVNKNARNSARIPEQRSSLRLSRRVSERLKRKSSSFSFPANSSVQVKTKRRLSENDVRLMSHRDVVLAPLTNDTYSILTNVGALTEASPQKEDIVASLTDSTWQPAKDALSAVRQDDVPPGGRPSLIMLKRQRAGMVSASVRKYDSISRSQCSTPKAMPSPSVRALKSPLRVPSIFVRGSSTNGSTRQQHQDLRQSIRKNDCAAKIPLTGFARRQSFNTKADGELSRSGSRSAESSPMSNETPKPSHSKPRPKSFSSPSNPIVRQSPSPLKDRNVLNRQTPRVNRVPLANTSGKVEVSSPVTNSVFKTPTSQAPQSRTRTPRSASHSTVITPGSQEKYQSPYRVVYQSFPQCQMPRVLNDSAKKLTKQMSLNKI